MECFNPVRLVNRRKFWSLDYADQFVTYVRCGKCASCQQNAQKEWYFRAFYEYQSTIRQDGYMYMDCLTYSPKYVPRLSRFIPKLPRELNFMCFDYTDLRYFFVRLRQHLKKKGFNVGSSLRYFASTEYGSSDKATHRPHIHILFYVTKKDLDSLTLSQAIAECWKYGRTDGLPYKSRKYVINNTIKSGVTSAIRSCKYVSKYVMKDSQFQKVVDARMLNVIDYLYHKHYKHVGDIDTFKKSEDGKKLVRDLKRCLNQFHRQSLGFGLYYLKSPDANIEEILNTNIVSCPDASKKVVNRIGLPLYYRRKLFYRLVDVDEGLKSWQPTELGLKYMELRYKDRKRQLSDEYNCAKKNYGVEMPLEIVDYVLNKRGRFVASKPSTTLDELLSSSEMLFSYVTPSDKVKLGKHLVISKYIGCAGNNYAYINELQQFNYSDLHEFIMDNVYFNPQLEVILQEYQNSKSQSNAKMQRLFDNRQRLNQIYKEYMC